MAGRTLVVGCGFIGSHVVRALAEQGTPATVLTRSRPARELSRGAGRAGLGGRARRKQ